jgi:hypothetical protein
VAAGFGHHRFTDAGGVLGAGEELDWGPVKIANLLNQSVHSEARLCPNAGSILANSHSGLLTQAASGTSTQTQEGDSGGPLLIGSGSTRAIVGVLYGNDYGDMAYTGIWNVRDWIKQNTDIWSAADCSSHPLPSQTSGGIYTTLGAGPDLLLHAATVRSDQTIVHSSSHDGKTWTYVDTLPPWAHANAQVGLVKENGPSPLLGLAWRDTATNQLLYTRRTSTGWANPISVLQGVTLKSNVAASENIVAFSRSDGRVGLLGWNGNYQVFGGLSWMPSGSPLADPGEPITITADPTNGNVAVGYFASAGQWVLALGNLQCFGQTQNYFCGSLPPVATNWTAAVLGLVPGDRTMIVDSSSPRILVSSIEQRAVYPTFDANFGQSFSWGQELQASGYLSVAPFNGQLYQLSPVLGSTAAIRPLGNCFANDW